MLRHMIVAHSAMNKPRQDLNAHAKLHGALHRTSRMITDFFRSLVH
ncbi:hypothetical protein [Hoeflea poritis]|uniref:Uncharacterized protein n=1 Tax=Hoeflea poritis TaxID=2993659 RepID=A0ABT4VUM2_9HYPH|nr:hypothetical protein [Hoeflea poritis]MDA4848412.1 hypothetical protein [Hoeflea poritis]